MTETSSITQYSGKLLVSTNQKPSFGDVLWRWFMFYLFRFWFYKWTAHSPLIKMINIIFVSLAIITTISWLLIPEHSYFFKVSNEKPTRSTPNLHQMKIDNIDIGEEKVLHDPSKIEEKDLYCPTCGNKHPAEAIFCGNCGTKLS